MIERIGYACKYMTDDQDQAKKVLESIQRPLNTRTTTATWLDRQDSDTAHSRVREIVEHNLTSVQRQLKYIVSLGIAELRMLRLSSDLLPFYTHPKWRCVYTSEVIEYAQSQFAKIGEYARVHDIRLSFHPGQFTVLASDRPDVVERSIEEFEYHVDMIRWMGYGNEFQDFKCNVHISGRQGPEGIMAVLPRLSTEAQNTITIENDEMSWGTNSSLRLEQHCALVLDIHHHWVRTGEYIQPNDDRVKRIEESWRGVRPVIHYSYSRDTALPEGFKHNSLPDMNRLLEAGHKKQKLRAHSDWYPNNLANDWALSFNSKFDIMCESKMKNLASRQLYNYKMSKQS